MVMPYQQLRDAVFGRVPILFPYNSSNPITPTQIQPATVDLRIEGPISAMWAAALPNSDETVEKIIEQFERYSSPLEVGKKFKLDRGMTYLIPLAEQCDFPPGTWAQFSPKSSTGRCDIFVRVLADKFSHYDRTPAGYRGRLYLEVTPLSFDVSVFKGLSLTQARIKVGKSLALSGPEITSFHMKYGIIFDNNGNPLPHNELQVVDDERGGRLYYHIDLNREVVGFVASRTMAQYLELGMVNTYNPVSFWQPIFRPEKGVLTLEPGRFYLLATKERTVIPNECCGEILSYEITTGEIRPHYAGFFDNGFGGKVGTNGVLEIRVRDVPFRVVHGQSICAMVFERTLEVPTKLYGSGNTYTEPGPSLSKHFKDRYEAWNGSYWRRADQSR
jgi:dCTP deaminase